MGVDSSSEVDSVLVRGEESDVRSLEPNVGFHEMLLDVCAVDTVGPLEASRLVSAAVKKLLETLSSSVLVILSLVAVDMRVEVWIGDDCSPRGFLLLMLEGGEVDCNSDVVNEVLSDVAREFVDAS